MISFGKVSHITLKYQLNRNYVFNEPIDSA